MTLLTEEEAKTKWCPYSNTHPSQAGAQCIGSSCMAWRKHDDGDRVEYDEKVIPIKPGECNPPFTGTPEGYEVVSYGSMTFSCRKETGRKPPRGYCGAFGKVEP